MDARVAAARAKTVEEALSASGENMGEAPANFAFRLDQPDEPIVFGDQLELSGWLVDLGGKPINGIRATVHQRFRRRKLFKARRKRSRPDVAAAYPQLPDARSSGFLVELQLPFGRCTITLQVLDHERVWRTFYRRTVRAFPLSFLRRLGLRNTQSAAAFALRSLFAHRGHSVTSNGGNATRDAEPTRTKNVELYATSKSNLFILEIGELITAGFTELGCNARFLIDEVPAENAGPDTLQIVVTPHEYYNLFLSGKVGRPAARQLSKNLLLLCTEQPETGWFQSNLSWGIYARALADINPLGVAAYRRRELRCHHLQLGYHPLLHSGEFRLHASRATDVVFLGSLTSRRDEFFAEHAGFFSEHRCHIRLVPLGFAKTKETRSYLSTERRNELLGNSKILLNVHYSDQKYFEWHRMLVGLANGCCIITETCEGYGPLIPGTHFIMVDREFLVPCCEYFLAHPEECERIARQGFEFVRDHLSQSQCCEKFLREVEQADRRAPANGTLPAQPMLPTDSPPTHLPRALQLKLARHTARVFGRAIAADARALSGESATAVETPGAAMSAETEAELRARTVEKRKAYHERLTAQANAEARGDATFELHDNDAYRRCDSPRLSVIITLYNYERFIDECVSSVQRAAANLREPVEVLIVNDASTDRSLEAALKCQRQHDIPIRVVDKKFNTGLADARNTGIKLARAPYLFMLDADNLVLPGAFRYVLEAISAGDYAAAFSILCRFRGSPENRVGLLSYYDWDPQILVQYPYIDAMAMFSRAALLEAGGYDNHLSQIGWFGWEDYDMWLRFADRGSKIAFVPNILCLYRHHETSMINTTNLFEVDLVHHLVGRYGKLAEAFEPREQLFGVDRHRLAALPVATGSK